MTGGRLRLLSLALLVCVVAAACSSAHGESEVAGPGWVNGPPPSGLPQAAPGAPNIIYVLTDDLSWNLVKYMPHVVAMQKNGVTFSRYFVTDSLCCPSRASILTGQFPHNTGVFRNTGDDGGFNAYLTHHDQDRSFATALAGQGYQTALFGKFLNDYNPESTYFDQSPYVPPGWSAWSVPDGGGYHEYHYNLAVGRQHGRYGSDPDDYLTSVLSDKAGQFIQASAQADQPFLAEIATYSPHAPFVPEPQDAEKFPHVTAPRGPAFGQAVRNAPRWLQGIPPLHGPLKNKINSVFRLRVQDVQSVDRMIGRLQAQVQRLGIADNTYFVFNSDNGLHLGEHNLHKGKSTAFDTDIKVPLIVTGPGVPAGRTISELAANIDLAPTFESLAGATPPATVNGSSLEPLLHGQSPVDWRDAFLVEHHGLELARSDPDFQEPDAGDPPSYEAIRTAHYLYVEYVDGEREFYNLARDPAELVNRYADIPPELHRQLHDTLSRMAGCHGAVDCWAAQHLVVRPAS